jgi:hypothetical protein
MIRKKPAPDLIRGGNRFSERIMLKRKTKRASSAAELWLSLPLAADLADHRHPLLNLGEGLLIGGVASH